MMGQRRPTHIRCCKSLPRAMESPGYCMSRGSFLLEAPADGVISISVIPNTSTEMLGPYGARTAAPLSLCLLACGISLPQSRSSLYGWGSFFHRSREHFSLGQLGLPKQMFGRE